MGVRSSIQVRDLGDGTALDVDRTVTTATVGNIFPLADVTRAVEAGELALDQPVSRTDADAHARRAL